MFPPPTVSAGETRYDNDGEDYLEDPVSQVTKQAAAQGASKASGGNGKVVQGEGNVVNTQQVTHIHHHHYTTNNSSLNVISRPATDSSVIGEPEAPGLKAIQDQ